MDLSPCPGIGLEIGLKARLSDYGSSGFLTLTAADTADAISSAHKVYDLQYLRWPFLATMRTSRAPGLTDEIAAWRL